MRRILAWVLLLSSNLDYIFLDKIFEKGPSAMDVWGCLLESLIPHFPASGSLSKRQRRIRERSTGRKHWPLWFDLSG